MSATSSERAVLDDLDRHYGATGPTGPRWITAEHVRSDAGFSAQRTIDFVAVDTWQGRGNCIHGHEVKVSRSDWLRELHNPQKAADVMHLFDFWWLVVADLTIVHEGELPKGWGLLAPSGADRLKVRARAARLTDRPRPLYTGWRPGAIERGFAVSILRAALKTQARACQHASAVNESAEATA